MAWLGHCWTELTRNAAPLRSGDGAWCASCAKHREATSASLPNSLSSGTCTVTLTIGWLCQGWPQLTRLSYVAFKSFSCPGAALRERCCKLWTSQCWEGPPTYLTFLTFIRAVRWHEMYVHIVTIYIKWPGIFQSLACPVQLWSFVCGTCTTGWSDLLLSSNRYRWKTRLLLIRSWSLSLQWTPSKPCIQMWAHWLPRPIHKWSPQREDQIFPNFWASFLSLLPVCVKGGWENRGCPKASGLTKGFCCQRLFFM